MNDLPTTMEETELRKGNSNLYRPLNTVTKRTTTEIKLVGI